MKKVFVDTNVLVDLIADRKPFSKFAIALFSKAESGNVSLYTSSHSIATTHYLLKKYLSVFVVPVCSLRNLYNSAENL
jgi:predicted nucleic acid-binding protein